MPLIDALANVGLPRYLSAEEFLRVMDEQAVEAAVLSATPACADLGELCRAAVRYPDRFRVIGSPAGASSAERRASVSAQLASGFLGIRLGSRIIVEEPDLLNQIGEANAVVFVAGAPTLEIAAPSLVDFLLRYPASLVCAPAFGAVGELTAGHLDSPASRLISHERFLAVFAGHGAFDQSVAKAQAVIQRIGWERALWGSDFPQSLWRGESYTASTVWIDKAGLELSAGERAAFFSENARRYLFDRQMPAPQPLPPPWNDARFAERELPVSLFPNDPIDLPEEAQHALLAAYLDRSGPGTYRDFIAEQLVFAAKHLGQGDKK